MRKTKNARPDSLFESEMRRRDFRRPYEAERSSFALEVQLLNLLESNQMTLADLAREMGVPRSNITRDLSQGRIQLATIPRVVEMANAANADFVPLILPRDPEKRRTVIKRLERVFA